MNIQMPFRGVSEKIAGMRRLYQAFSPHLKPHRRRMFISWLCMIGTTCAYLAQPWPIKMVFDYILLPVDEASANDVLATLSASDILMLCALSVMLIAVLRGLFGFGQTYLSAAVGQQVIGDIRVRLFNHIQRLSRSFHDEQHSGDLLLRLTGDIHLMRDMLVNAVLMITERLLVMIAVAGLMLWMDWQLGLVALAVIPALSLVSVRVSSQMRQITRKQRRKESRTANILAETLSAVPLIQAFNREDWENERFSKQHGASLKAGLKATRLQANLNRVVEVILAAGTAAVIWFGVHRVMAGQLTAGDLLVFTAYLSTLYKPVRKLSTLTSRLSKSVVCGERLLAILHAKPEIQDLPDAIEAPAFEGHIVCDEMGFRYKNGKQVFQQTHLEIAAGQNIAIMGPSGSGKSTLAHLLLRFYEPQSGRICIDGVDIRQYTLGSVRSQISTLMQEPHLFALSIRDNIAYGQLDASDEDVEWAAKRAHAHDFIQALPDGYATVLAEGGSSLSAGQKQRLAIARAMVRKAPIVILDEPMTGLDRESEALVQAALDNLAQGKTCLVITHDQHAASRCDRILKLENGALTEISVDALKIQNTWRAGVESPLSLSA